jgi:hypothetical protein
MRGLRQEWHNGRHPAETGISDLYLSASAFERAPGRPTAGARRGRVSGLFLEYGFLLILGALTLLFDLFVAFLGAAVLGRAMRLAVAGTDVTGHIAAIRDRRRSRGQAGVRVAYETPAGTLETSGTSQRPRVGAPVTVRYDPARPARATTLLRPARTAATGIPVVLAVAAASAGMVAGSAFYFAGVYSGLQLPLAGGGFALALALACGFYARGRYAELLRWGRMVSVPGKIARFDEHGPGGRGILISFDSGEGQEEFWARAGSVLAGVGDTVMVYYDPARPAGSATVETPPAIRAHAIAGTVMALFMFALAVLAITLR